MRALKKNRIVLVFVTALLVSCSPGETTQTEIHYPTDGPIQLHPKNPHYFLYQGQTLALVTSAEHYGAVLNQDFDYKAYLSTLSNDGMNYTRIFTGSYFEIPGESFGIQKNSLAPKKGRVITPWKVATTDTVAVKYDLSTWNEAYFDRLHDFMRTAAENKVIVEVTLFSSIYRDAHWEINPQNPANNINLRDSISRFDAQTLNNGALFRYQESFVRKMVQELNIHENFFFEIQNEPWSDHTIPVYNIVNKEELNPRDWTYKADFADDASMAWQERLATIIAEEEAGLPKKHLIAQNYTNFKAPIPSVSGRISIINFHYAWPEAVEWNYHYNKVIGFDESGFAGSEDLVYRRQAWTFMLSGGGLFNNLDYSFYVGKEDGTGENKAPGGGSPAYRKQLKTLSHFLHSFELEKLYPNSTSVISSPGLVPYVLSDESKAFAIYLRAVGTETASLKLKVADGNYKITVINPVSGSVSGPTILSSSEGLLHISVASPEGEVALRIEQE